MWPCSDLDPFLDLFQNQLVTIIIPYKAYKHLTIPSWDGTATSWKRHIKTTFSETYEVPDSTVTHTQLGIPGSIMSSG